MGWFTGRDAKERLSSIKTLVEVMTVDGKLDKQELAFLAMACARVGIKESELQKVIKNPGSVLFTPPRDDRERILRLMDMVFMMLADGKIEKREMDFCMSVAGRLGFNPSIIPQLTSDVVKKIQGGNKPDQVVADVESFLNG